MTGSGDLQKRSVSLQKPIITLRDETEWAALIELGVNVLLGAYKKKIIAILTDIRHCVVSNHN